MVSKLLILASDFPNEEDTYIANIFVKEQVKALAKLLSKIIVIIPIPVGIEEKRKILYRSYQIGRNVDVFFVRYLNPLFPISYYHFKKQWIKIEAEMVKKFIEKQKMDFDMIHAHYTWPSGAVAIELKRNFGVPVIITEHASISFKKALQSKDEIYLNAWKSADAIIRVRKGDISEIKELGIKADKVYYIPNGFDGQKFKPIPKSIARQKLGLLVKKKIALSIGSLTHVKGHKYLIEAMRYAVREHPNLMAIIIGNGPLRGALKRHIRNLGLNDYISLVGAKPHHEIPLWMNAADVFVLPSLSEGNPTVMFEALGVGLPFIGTMVGGVPEIIISEEYGLLVEPANHEDLASKLLLALKKKWNKKKIRKYAQQFDWGNIAQQTIRLYRKILDH
jgi:glycosyltransferase involved in cell wall biosynthesis